MANHLEVMDFIKRMKIRKGSGCAGINRDTEMLFPSSRKCHNKCVQKMHPRNYVSKNFKISKVVPILKKVTEKSRKAEKYKPTSILSC